VSVRCEKKKEKKGEMDVPRRAGVRRHADRRAGMGVCACGRCVVVALRERT
jgi:hypothetical protein